MIRQSLFTKDVQHAPYRSFGLPILLKRAGVYIFGPKSLKNFRAKTTIQNFPYDQQLAYEEVPLVLLCYVAPFDSFAIRFHAKRFISFCDPHYNVKPEALLF